MKQTAVEWLTEKYNEVNWLRNRDEISSKYADELREVFFYQAKEMEKQQNDTSKVKRVEVIQHSPPYNGRAFTKYNAKDVEIQFQDDGYTLKIFLK